MPGNLSLLHQVSSVLWQVQPDQIFKTQTATIDLGLWDKRPIYLTSEKTKMGTTLTLKQLGIIFFQM